MKDNLDVMLVNAFATRIEPGEELNALLLEKAFAADNKTENRSRLQRYLSARTINKLMKVAAIILAFLFISAAGVYAAGKLMKVFVYDKGLSTGNQEYVSDDDFTYENEDIKVENVSHDEAGQSDRWISKDVQVLSGTITNTYYNYDNYEWAMEDSGLDVWLSKVPGEISSVVYVNSVDGQNVEDCVDSIFKLGEGQVYVSESRFTGNYASDVAHNIVLENTKNVRTYKSSTGNEFTLVDEVRDEDGYEMITTYVMISYGDYTGFVSFNNISEKEIHTVLDTIKLGE